MTGRPPIASVTARRGPRGPGENIAMALLLAMLTGCASAPKPLSPGQEQALVLNRQGMESFAAGDVLRAQRAFEAALVLERSVENEDGIALNLLNLAQCHQRLGLPELAARRLDQLLGDATLTFAPQRRAEAALQHALLALQRHDVAAAERWQRQGVADCGATCALAGKLHNLGARLALERGEASAALTAATAALGKSEGDAVERANALRLQGAAQLALGQRALAEAALVQAMALDKDGGQGDKVYQDLLLLGRSSADSQLQRRYWQRALAVAQALGKAAAVKEIEALLAALNPTAAEPVKTGN